MKEQTPTISKIQQEVIADFFECFDPMDTMTSLNNMFRSYMTDPDRIGLLTEEATSASNSEASMLIEKIVYLLHTLDQNEPFR